MKKPLIAPDIIKLQDILDAIEALATYKTDDLSARNNLHAAAFECTIIGEASRQISDAFKKEHSNLPWRELQDTRNKIVHDYGRINPKKIMQIIDDDLPQLRE